MRLAGPVLSTFVGLFLLSAATLPAEELDPETLQQVVESAGAKFAKAFDGQDAKALAALFTPSAEYVDSTGVIFHGRDTIEAEYSSAFEVRPPGTLTLELLSIRPIADGIVVEDGVSTFTPKDEGPSSRMRYTATHVKQADGSWLLASVRELEAPVLTPHDRLLALAWLLGKWRDETDGQVARTEWKWSESGNYLEANFRVSEQDEPVLEGTHRIGWDGQHERFRSWVFLSNGNFATGLWNEDTDGNWNVALAGTSTDGTATSSLMTYVRDGDDAVGVYQTQRIAGGESLPSRSIRVVRQPPAPAVTSVGK